MAFLQRLDLSSIRDVPPVDNPYDELDVGDPISERACRYRYRDSLARPIGWFLMQGEGFWDGGRPGVTQEEFDLSVPDGGGVLVARYKGSFSGAILDLIEKSPVAFRLDAANLTVSVDGMPVFNRDVRFDEGFSYVEIPVHRGGLVHFSVRGLVNSFHYWTYPPPGENTQPGSTSDTDSTIAASEITEPR